MPKMKTKRAAAKRFRVTGSGQYKHKRAYRSHMMSNKTVKQKRHLREDVRVAPVDEGHLKRMLPHQVK
ncbi:MAG: 50S ribosomal protein L35 [Deltaproteobacteria bacterium]|nr:50S ribosomal protein L35 [Deltaproteobacteria bacterium]